MSGYDSVNSQLTQCCSATKPELPNSDVKAHYMTDFDFMVGDFEILATDIHYHAVDWMPAMRCTATSLTIRRQSIQNAASRLVTGIRQCDLISSVPHQLYSLPVRQRVGFKVSSLVHQALSGHASSYLADD